MMQDEKITYKLQKKLSYLEANSCSGVLVLEQIGRMLKLFQMFDVALTSLLQRKYLFDIMYNN